MTKRWTVGVSGFAVVLVGAVVTACAAGSSAHGADLHEAKPAVSASVPGYQVPAHREADRLRDLVQLPPGSTTFPTAPAALLAPAGGTTASSDWVDAPRFARVPLGVAQSLDYLRAHDPDGLPARGGGTLTRSAGAPQISFEDFVDRSTPQWNNAYVEVDVQAVDATTSNWRIDGQAVAVDLTPARVQDVGTPLRLTVAGGCLASNSTGHGPADVSNADTGGLDTALLPAATPTGALVCSYDGLNGHAFTLVESVHVTDATALVRAVRASDLGHSTGRGSCPDDVGTADILVFSYTGRPDVDVLLSTSGCRGIDNGVISGTPTDTLNSDVAALVGSG